MSQRTIVEFNHDYAHDVERCADLPQMLSHAMGSDDPCTSPSACEWLGWRLGYAWQSMKRLRTMELLGVQDQD